MFTSTTAVGRRSVRWLIPALVLCIAVPAMLTTQGCGGGTAPVKPTPTPTPPLPTSTLHTITFAVETGNLVCPNMAEIKVSLSHADKVQFVNNAPVVVTITTLKQAFEGVTPTTPIKVLPGASETRTIWQGLTVGDNIELTMELPPDYAVDGCSVLPQGQHGPGMQVNP